MVNYISLAARNLVHRRTRSLLTIIGIFIGIAAVVALISLSSGLNNVISSEFQKIGADKVLIMPGGMTATSGMTANPLTEDDARAVKNVPGVQLVGSILVKDARAEFSGETKNVFSISFPTDAQTMKMLEDVEGSEIAEGRNFRPSDKYVIAVGSAVADGKSVFKKKVVVGSKMVINGHPFEVIAVLKSGGSPTGDKAVYMPLDVARTVFNEPSLITEMVVQVSPGIEPSSVGAAIKKKLRQRRGEKEGEESFTVQTPEQLAATFGAILGVVQAVFIGIAAISLLVGGIGIMNTMYTSVLERTKEIGIMKAIGARNSDVMLLFLTESGMLGLLGGAIGIAIGALLAYGAQVIAQQALGSNLLQASFAPELIGGALAFSFLAGAISGVLPARRAASLKPVDALRYE